MTDHDRRDQHDSDTQRMTVPEAARRLGITEGAVRKRVERGKMRAEHDASGHLIVYLEEHATRATDATRDRPRQARLSRDTVLVEELRDRLRFVERQLEAERQAHAEARRIIGGLVQRIPELEAPGEPRESPETAAEATEGVEPRSSTPGEQEPAQGAEAPQRRRSWWREFFGFGQ